MLRTTLVCTLTLAAACVASGPFQGPGFQDDTLITDTEGPYLAVATRAIIAQGKRAEFNDHVGRIADQLENQPGCIGYELRGRVPGREVWTLTVWESEAAMLEFVVSGAHGEAMPQASGLVEEFDSAPFEVAADALPLSWDVVEAELDKGPAPVAY